MKRILVIYDLIVLICVVPGGLCDNPDPLFGSVRDFIQSVKDVFSDIFPGYSVFFKKFGETLTAAIDEECVFKCPNGRTPRPNIYHEAKPNGCGVPGLHIPKYVPSNKLEECCNEHDICYATCNKDKEKCDEKFKHCVYGICSFFERIVNEDIIKGCKAVAKTLYTAVTAMGCKYYLDAQKDACICDTNYYNQEEF